MHHWTDLRVLTPTFLLCRFLAFDRHFNLVLADAEEYRKLPPKKGKTEAEVSRYILLSYRTFVDV